MAASEPLTTQTLDPQPSIPLPLDGDDSTIQPSYPPPLDSNHDASNSQSTSTDDAVSVGEKRKRDDPPPSDSSLHPLWKTSLCSYFRRNSASCSHGDACRYAHSEEELRPRPDNTWDPTSERAKKALRSQENEENAEREGREEDIMMTEEVVNDEDNDNDSCSEPGLSKCLVHLPRKWNSENLRKFLAEQASRAFSGLVTR